MQARMVAPVCLVCPHAVGCGMAGNMAVGRWRVVSCRQGRYVERGQGHAQWVQLAPELYDHVTPRVQRKRNGDLAKVIII